MQTKHHFVLTAALAVALFVGRGLTARDAEAHTVKNRTRTSVHRNRNVSRNRKVHVNRSVTRNLRRDIDIDVDADRGWHDGWGHPVATAAGVVGATTVSAVAFGTVVRTLPPACSITIVGAVPYQSCGGSWYQPRYAGMSLTYLSVSPPR